MPEPQKPTVWKSGGKDKYFEHYRKSKAESSKTLRKWVDEAYYDNGLSKYLDANFVTELRHNDFYSRLWELELAEWLQKTGNKLPTT